MNKDVNGSISHNAEDIRMLCDFVWELIKGELIEYENIANTIE